MPLTGTQRGVLRGIAPAVAITVIALGAAIGLWPESRLPAAAFAARAAWAAGWALLPVAALLAAIGRMAQHRFFTPEDIDGSGLTQGTAYAHVLQSVVQNTLEQTALAVPVYLGWGLLMPQRLQGAVAAAAVLFVIGRALFALGYSRGAPGRALGFGLTFYPTAALLLIIALHRAVAG